MGNLCDSAVQDLTCEVDPARIPVMVGAAAGNAVKRCPLCGACGPVTVLPGNRRTLKRCRRCRVAYLSPRPTESDMSAFFANEYISTDEDVEVRFGTRPRKYLRRVAGFIRQRKSGGRILDLGCAGGYFLDRFFSAQDWEKWGVDLSKFAATSARNKSIRVHTGDIHSAALPEGAFDAVTVLDTLFYFPEPSRELGAIHRALKPNGLLVITAPCAGSHIWRNTGWRAEIFGGSRNSVLETRHLFFYNPRSLTFLLRRSSFEIIAVQPLPAIDQGSFWRNRLADAYHAMSHVVWFLTLSRLMLAPRFMVAAIPRSMCF
jgi:SAM-dependent methyltransferase